MKEKNENKDLNTDKRKTAVKWLKIILFLAVIVGIPVVLFVGVPGFGNILTDREAFRVFMTEHSRQGIAVYLLIQYIQVVIGFLPGQIIQFVGGYVFGIVLGLILSLIGTAFGTFTVFYLTRHFGREFVSLFVKEKRLNKFIDLMDSGKGYTIVILVYLIPGLPKDVFTYAAGLTRLRPLPFTILTIIARAPAMLATILLSGFLYSENYIGVLVVIIVIATLLIIIFIKRKSLFALIERLHTKIR